MRLIRKKSLNDETIKKQKKQIEAINTVKSVQHKNKCRKTANAKK